MGLCIELARRSSEATNPVDALGQFFAALYDLRRMLRARSGRLSAEAIRGLVAEMSFALDSLLGVVDIESALAAWRGPFGAPQDFQLAGGQLVEIKAVHTGSKSIEISSAEQLDPSSNGELYLALITVEEAADDRDGLSLRDLQQKFVTAIGASTSLRDALDERLSAVGFDVLDDYYSADRYVVSPPIYFEVAADFPRITRHVVPLAVERLTYRLRVSGFSSFQRPVPEWLIKKVELG
jgi:hypothetical protein